MLELPRSGVAANPPGRDVTRQHDECGNRRGVQMVAESAPFPTINRTGNAVAVIVSQMTDGGRRAAARCIDLPM